MLHTLFPIPGRREYLVLTSSTPNVELKEQFFEVFDAVAETLRFVDGSDGSDGSDGGTNKNGR